MSKNSPYVALLGNPNSGKTAIFNRLTGLNLKVSNYPGITVEKRIGVAHLSNEKSANKSCFWNFSEIKTAMCVCDMNMVI